jgi:plasmid maintenance system antidote protein VapI
MTHHEFQNIVKVSSRTEHQVTNHLKNKCGIDLHTYQRYLSGELKISPSMAILIKKAFGYA